MFRFAATRPSSPTAGWRRTSNSTIRVARLAGAPGRPGSTKAGSRVQVSSEPFAPATTGSTTAGTTMLLPLKLVVLGT